MVTKMLDMTNERLVVAATICGEADDQPFIGKQAVGATLFNRVVLHKTHRHFGDGSLISAALSPYAYSCWLPGLDKDRIQNLDYDKPYPALKDCLDIADQIIAKVLHDPTYGATHYYNPDIVKAPTWVTGVPEKNIPPATFCGKFGDHLFYKNVR